MKAKIEDIKVDSKAKSSFKNVTENKKYLTNDKVIEYMIDNPESLKVIND